MKIAEEKMKKAADTIRCLCSDMIDKAHSGHPGAPLGLADIAVSLWLNYLNFDPKDVPDDADEPDDMDSDDVDEEDDFDSGDADELEDDD